MMNLCRLIRLEYVLPDEPVPTVISLHIVVASLKLEHLVIVSVVVVHISEC